MNAYIHIVYFYQLLGKRHFYLIEVNLHDLVLRVAPHGPWIAVKKISITAFQTSKALVCPTIWVMISLDIFRTRYPSTH
jgi:hypothetical protein